MDLTLGRTFKGRSRPMKQLVVKTEFKELLENLEATDSMDQHITEQIVTDHMDYESGNNARY